MLRNSPRRHALVWDREVLMRENEVQRAADRLHPDKGCGSLPARRYDLLPDRSRSAGPSYRPSDGLISILD